MRRIGIWIIIGTLCWVSVTEAGRRGKISREAAEAFTQEFDNARSFGPEAFQKFVSEVMNGGSNERVEMLKFLLDNKTADGRRERTEEEINNIGFMGDPNDPGPVDWSDWEIETDANGNVTGFKEKDFDKKDIDGDGKISDAERAQWDKKRQEEWDEAGGPPGQVPPTPDWDRDGDGKPDPGFTLDCWRCVPKPGCVSDEDCDDGDMCTENRCLGGECVAYPVEECLDPEPCDPREEACGEPPPCDPEFQNCDDDFVCDPETGECGEDFVCDPQMESCYQQIIVETTWIIVIIETPWERFILKDGAPLKGFKASQVMALANVKSLREGVSTLTGILGGGVNPLAAIGGQMDLRTMAQTLSQGLAKGKKYGQNCFDRDFEPADLSAQEKVPEAYTPPKKKKKRKNAKAAPSQEAFVAQGAFGYDPSRDILPDGPIVACGSVGKQKALAIMDAAGRPIEVILRDQLKKNPNAITDALVKAQAASQMVRQIQRQGIRSFLQQKMMSLGKSWAEKATAALEDRLAFALTEKEKIVPNDPYYKIPEKKKKKKLFGILGSSKPPPKIIIGSGMRMGGRVLGAGTERTHGREKFQAKDQWGLHRIGYTPLSDPRSAWNAVDFQTKNVIVAVIDSGLDMAHQDAPQYIWKNPKEIPDNGIDDDQNGFIDDVYGWNFLDGTNDVTDEKGHGSFVAGIIAAKWNNGVGIAGINPGAIIMPLKVADKEGQANSFNIARAIYYAVDHGARVINISLGARNISHMEYAALRYARARGVFVAMASGNVGENIGAHGPASGTGFAVGAIDYDGTRSTISNWGPNNGILAPGEQIYSLIATGTGKGLKKSLQKAGYYPQSGTSFSTPMVAATASLLLVNNPDLTPEDIEDILHRTATEMYDPGWDGKSGAGLLNAAKALRYETASRLTAKITATRKNRNKKKKIESVDVFGTVRGAFSSFVVEVGKGRRGVRKFRQKTKVFHQPADDQWLVRLSVKEDLRGSQEWVIRLRVMDKQGQEHFAETLLELK